MISEEEKKDCLMDEVWTCPSDKKREGNVWLYPIHWGNRFEFEVPAKNKIEAIKIAIGIIAEEQWDEE